MIPEQADKDSLKVELEDVLKLLEHLAMSETSSDEIESSIASALGGSAVASSALATPFSPEPAQLALISDASTVQETRSNYGQISNMAMPAGWVPGEQLNNVVGNSSFRQFHPSDNPDVRLSFYYRGRRTSEAAGEKFRRLLEERLHLLSRKELEAIAETVRDKAGTSGFKLFRARTEDINGKHVLIVEGRFVEIQQDTRCMLVDADGTGTVVQEIAYQAPLSKYLRYLGQAKAAMDSIHWM